MRASCKGEADAVAVLDASIHAAVAVVCDKYNQKLCAAFAVVDTLASLWKGVGFMPPMLRSDTTETVGLTSLPVEPVARPIDCQAAFFLRAERPHRSPRNLYGVIRNVAAPSASTKPTSATRKPSLTSRCAEGGAPLDPRCQTAPTPQRRRELFALADTRQKGSITAKQLHAWLALQGSISLSEVKKLVSARGVSPLEVDVETFASILSELEASNPERWGAVERLCVYARPKPQLDLQALADERELRDILQTRDRHIRTNTALLSTTANSTSFSQIKGGASTTTLGESKEALWGKTEVVSQTMLSRAHSTGRGTGRDDRLQGIAAQVKITSPHRKSSSRPPSSAVSKSDLSSPDKRLQDTRLLSTSRSHRKNFRELAHSKSLSSGVRFQLDSVRDRPLQSWFANEDIWSAFDFPTHVQPHKVSQTSLVENHEFVPKAGVSAKEKIGQGATSKNLLVRCGPTWPADPNHISRAAYEEMRAALLDRQRPSTAPAAQIEQAATVASLPPDIKSPESEVREAVPRHRSIGRRADSEIDEGTVIVTPLHRQAAEELFAPTVPLPYLDEHNATESMFVLDQFNHPALTGAHPRRSDPASAGKQLNSNQHDASSVYTLPRNDAAVLERLDKREAEAIRELHGEAACPSSARLATLPMQQPAMRLRNHSLVSCSNDGRVFRERAMPIGKAFRMIREQQRRHERSL